jgi:hypothetical protein
VQDSEGIVGTGAWYQQDQDASETWVSLLPR